MKKPADMQIKEYMARVVKINNYFPQFPPTAPLGKSKKLSNDKLLDVLKFGIPLKWRNQMHLQKFKVREHTIKEIINICERLESTFSDLPSRKQTNKGLSDKNKYRGNKKLFSTTTTTAEKINSTVFYTARTQLTIQIISKPLSNMMRSTKRIALATRTISATTKNREIILTKKRSMRSCSLQGKK